jgi:hypothetical protein
MAILPKIPGQNLAIFLPLNKHWQHLKFKLFLDNNYFDPASWIS